MPSTLRLFVPATVALVIAVASFGCGDSRSSTETSSERAGPFTVYAVNYPLCYFAERIGGGRVNVVFPAPRDLDPAWWKPDRETVLRFQRADLILRNGASYAKWAEMVSLPVARVVDTSRSFADRYIELENVVVHAHGPGGEHAHGGTAFTTWLDPLLAIEQARAVLQRLSNELPDHRPEFESNFKGLERDLRALDAELAAAVARDPGRPLCASHPVYQYLARRYDLNLRSVHWEPDAMPSPQEWQEFTALRGEHPAGWMIWESQPLEAVAEHLEQIGVRSVVFDPCGNVPADGDFMTVMHADARALSTVFSD